MPTMTDGRCYYKQKYKAALNAAKLAIEVDKLLVGNVRQLIAESRQFETIFSSLYRRLRQTPGPVETESVSHGPEV